ncbi:hydrogenase maturation nickel metallochaperone HypA [Streptomyces sp. NPDC059631]|uniref:hydrogenase maturation nickel metallochaperone HypA n=1 Tax=unclassified Streptomyces TaxID=2593676 RepID=UPI003674702B
MHELSIAMAVVEQVQEAAAEHGHDAASSVSLRLGELAGVVPEALRFSFGLAAVGTVLEGARLCIEQVPGRARCASCDTEWATGVPPSLWCPRCRGSAADLVSGRELQIAEVRWTARTDPPVTASPHEES